MDYHNHYRIGPHVSISMPYFYDLPQSSAYQTPRLAFVNEVLRLPPVTDAPRLPPPMETYKTNAVNVGFLIHRLELEAYAAVLEAFKIQSDLISWGKEGLITELRKELNVTDQEHRMLLTHINSDQSIKMIRELQQGAFHTREVPRNISYAPGSVPFSDSRTPQHNVKLSGAEMSMQQRYATHGQPVPAPLPSLPLQNWDDFRNGHLSTHQARNTEKLMKVAPTVTNHSGNKSKGPKQTHSKNLIHVAEVHNLKKKSGIIQICATETVLSKVNNVFFGKENPGPDQVDKAKSMLMEQEIAILEALAKLADVTNEVDSPGGGHHDQQESEEQLGMMGKRVKTLKNVYCQVDAELDSNGPDE